MIKELNGLFYLLLQFSVTDTSAIPTGFAGIKERKNHA
jgi:hypothetical protein